MGGNVTITHINFWGGHKEKIRESRDSIVADIHYDASRIESKTKGKFKTISIEPYKVEINT